MSHHASRCSTKLGPVESPHVHDLIRVIQRASIDVDDAQPLAERLRPDRIGRDLEDLAIGIGPARGGNGYLERSEKRRKDRRKAAGGRSIHRSRLKLAPRLVLDVARDQREKRRKPESRWQLCKRQKKNK